MNHPALVRGRHLPFLGRRRQGAVYQLDPTSCIQLFANPRQCRREVENLRRGQTSGFFPNLYEWGQSYLVREYVPGITLAEHLEEGGALSREMAQQLVEILTDLKTLGFRRLDFRTGHIAITPTGRLKLRDTASLNLRPRSRPLRLLAELRSYGALEPFAEALRQTRPDWAKEWLAGS